eukprot:1137690-Pelagomonas_calceolata.AAC.5
MLRPLKDGNRSRAAAAGGLKVILGPGVFKAFDLCKMDIIMMPMSWKEVASMKRKEKSTQAKGRVH